MGLEKLLEIEKEGRRLERERCVKIIEMSEMENWVKEELIARITEE